MNQPLTPNGSQPDSTSIINRIVAFALEQWVLIVLLSLLLVGSGIWALQRLPLDAYPDLVFAAKLDQLAPIGEGGDFSNKLRTFVVIVSIEGNDPKLMPDLSAAVDVDITKQSAGPTTAQTSGSGS